MRWLWLWSLCSSVALAQAAAADQSLYATEVTLRTDAGEAFPLRSLEGRPVLLTFVYTNCASTCPVSLGKLRRIQAALDAEKLKAELVLVSIDPDRDTPQALQAFRRHQKLERPNWHLLTGRSADVRLLATALGFRFAAADANGQVMHDNKIFLLDARGEVAAQVSSVDAEMAPLLAVLRPLR